MDRGQKSVIAMKTMQMKKSKDFCGLVTHLGPFVTPLHSEETMISPAWRHRGPGQQTAVMKTKAQRQLMPGGQTFGTSEAMPHQRWPVPESDRTKPPRKIFSLFFAQPTEKAPQVAVIHSRGRCFSPVVAKPTCSVALYAVKTDFMMKIPNAAENGCRRRGDESLRSRKYARIVREPDPIRAFLPSIAHVASIASAEEAAKEGPQRPNPLKLKLSRPVQSPWPPLHPVQTIFPAQDFSFPHGRDGLELPSTLSNQIKPDQRESNQIKLKNDHRFQPSVLNSKLEARNSEIPRLSAAIRSCPHLLKPNYFFHARSRARHHASRFTFHASLHELPPPPSN